MIEVEMKFELSPKLEIELQEMLQSMSFEGKKQNLDIYYDTTGCDLLKQGVFVRIRNDQQLEFKFNTDCDKAHLQSREYTFSLYPEPNMTEEMNDLFNKFLPKWCAASDFKTTMLKNELIELAYIQKTRVVYSKDDLILSIDHVQGLGDFLEAEIQCDEDADTEEAHARLQSFASIFNLQLIQIGYVEMWLLIHNPQAYQLGRYRL